jgi:hypothetical protein
MWHGGQAISEITPRWRGKMKGSKYSCEITLAALLITVACACAPKLAPPKSAETISAAPEAQKPSHTAGSPIPQAPGLVVHIDPVTGEILPKPPVAPAGQKLEPQLFQSAPAPAPQLLEVPSAAPGGGVKVNLNRQFHQPLLATMDAHGKIKIEHRPARQADTESK